MARPIAIAGILFLGAALGACRSDSRFDKLTVGIPKDSALALIGVEKPARTDPYLVGGHYIEALYYAKPGADSTKVPDRELAPVIVVDGVLVGWGWKQWDSIATANKIEVEKR